MGRWVDGAIAPTGAAPPRQTGDTGNAGARTFDPRGRWPNRRVESAGRLAPLEPVGHKAPWARLMAGPDCRGDAFGPPGAPAGRRKSKRARMRRANSRRLRPRPRGGQAQVGEAAAGVAIGPPRRPATVGLLPPSAPAYDPLHTPHRGPTGSVPPLESSLRQSLHPSFTLPLTS